MSIRIGRTLPPAAAPLTLTDIFYGIAGLISGSSVVARFKQELQTYYNVRHCFLLSSGKAALVLILKGLNKLSPGRDEVLIPAFTCYSVPSAIAKAGFKVRICDIDPDTLDFDYDELEHCLANPRILCVVPTHLFGIVSDVPRLKALVADREIFIVEDAAQAMGSELAGLKAGTLGDVGFFSLGRGKVITAVEGGIILTDSERIGTAIAHEMLSVPEAGFAKKTALLTYAIALKLLVHPLIFWVPKMIPFLRLGETHFESVFPLYRLTGLQAGLAARWQLTLLQAREIRKKNVEKLLSFVQNTPIHSKVAGVIRFPMYLSSVDEKAELLRKSSERGLGISDGYPDTVDTIEELADNFVGGSSGKAKKIVSHLITLPVHPYITDNDISEIRSILPSNKESTS